MPGSRVIAALVTSVIAIACSPYQRGDEFACSVDAQCSGPGRDGRCEGTGFCSFIDDTCGSGRRYGELSGPVANACVETDAGVDVPDAPAEVFCDPADTLLAGCWAFEGMTSDASMFHNDGTATNVGFAAGRVEMAVVLDANSVVAIADADSLVSPAITMEAWLRPAQMPIARAGVFDNDGSYGMFVGAEGELRCATSVSLVTSTNLIALDQWSHVACTFDGTVARAYVNGDAVAMLGGGSSLGPGSNAGSAIGGNSPPGDPFVGLVDQVRVWRNARSAAQICTAARRASCL